MIVAKFSTSDQVPLADQPDQHTATVQHRNAADTALQQQLGNFRYCRICGYGDHIRRHHIFDQHLNFSTGLAALTPDLPSESDKKVQCELI